MAQKFSLTVTIKKQNGITIPAGKKHSGEYRDGVEVQGFEYGVKAPYDASSGSTVGGRRRWSIAEGFAHGLDWAMVPLDDALPVPHGVRLHNPVKITKVTGSTTPSLFQSLATDEILKDVTIHVYWIGPTGKKVRAHRVELTNSRVVNVRRGVAGSGKWQEDVTLTYDKLVVDGKPEEAIPDAYLM